MPWFGALKESGCAHRVSSEEPTLTTFVFRRQMTVEFGHCDPARMVTPKHLFEYFDNGTWSLFEAALGSTGRISSTSSAFCRWSTYGSITARP
jgi:hypothetical protein